MTERPTQEELDRQDRLHASIVEGLRRAGWPREDAIEEADVRVFRATPPTDTVER